MALQRKDYPKEWDAIRAKILDRDGHRCVQCGVKNYSVGVRLDDGTFLMSAEAKDMAEARAIAKELRITFGIEPVIITLACAHLDNPDPLDVREENLGMLCQYHHKLHDKYHHNVKAQATRARSKARRYGRRMSAGGNDAAYDLF